MLTFFSDGLRVFSGSSAYGSIKVNPFGPCPLINLLTIIRFISLMSSNFKVPMSDVSSINLLSLFSGSLPLRR